jgi:myosin-3
MQTMAMKTRQSLIELLKKLVHGAPHFVRCLRRSKSNAANIVLDKAYLAEQIRSCNLIETIKIRQNGYAYRIPFIEFLRRYSLIYQNIVCVLSTLLQLVFDCRYQFLAFDYEETVDMTPDNCRLLLLRLKMPEEGWMIGKTKIFLKYHVEEFLARFIRQ